MSSSDPIRRPDLAPEPAGPSLMTLARICGTGLGFIILLVGMWAVLRVFLTLLGHFAHPEQMTAGLAAWSQAMANVEAGGEINGQKVDLKGIVVVASYWLGWIVLSWLAVSLLYAGARIIHWTTSDQEAVKRILTEAFGNWRRLHERE
jgi:hypothetical protein